MSYKVSKDYPRLKQLLDEGHKVVCWVTYDWSQGDGHMVTDIAEAKRIGEGEYMHYMISVRGIVSLMHTPTGESLIIRTNGCSMDGKQTTFSSSTPTRHGIHWIWKE